jgi:hypothetical protein
MKVTQILHIIMGFTAIMILKEMVSLFILIVITTWDSGNSLKLMVMELISIFKEWDIQVHGKMITSMDRENSFGKTVQFLKESFSMGLRYMVSSPGPTALLT